MQRSAPFSRQARLLLLTTPWLLSATHLHRAADLQALPVSGWWSQGHLHVGRGDECCRQYQSVHIPPVEPSNGNVDTLHAAAAQQARGSAALHTDHPHFYYTQVGRRSSSQHISSSAAARSDSPATALLGLLPCPAPPCPVSAQHLQAVYGQYLASTHRVCYGGNPTILQETRARFEPRRMQLACRRCMTGLSSTRGPGPRAGCASSIPMRGTTVLHAVGAELQAACMQLVWFI